MKIKPLKNRLLVKRDPEQTTTHSGIYIPDNVQKYVFEGVVLETGSGKRILKKGDRVLWKKYDGVEVGKEKLLILREDDVWAVRDS